MQAEIVTRPDFWIIGLHYRGTYEQDQLLTLWRQFWPRHTEIKGRTEPIHAFGVIVNYDPGTKTMDYWAGVEAQKKSKVPKGMAKCWIPAQTYAVFQCSLPTLTETIKKIYTEWLPSSAYRRADGPEFELYDERFDMDREQFDMSFWLPIEEG